MTGCIETPGYKSKFCSKHAAQIVVKENNPENTEPARKKFKTKYQTRSEFKRRLKLLQSDLEPGIFCIQFDCCL